MVSSAKLRCDLPKGHSLVFSDKHFNFLLNAFSRGTSQLTTTWLIGDVRVSIFEVFYPSSDTASTHAGISIHMTQSAVDICSGVVPVSEQFKHYTLAKCYVESHFITMDCGNINVCMCRACIYIGVDIQIDVTNNSCSNDTRHKHVAFNDAHDFWYSSRIWNAEY